MTRLSLSLFLAAIVLGGCATRDQSLRLAQEVTVMLDAYDRELAQTVLDQNRFYSERSRDHARAQLDMLPGRREQIRASRAIAKASEMAGSPEIEARRGHLMRFLLEVAAEERALDNMARQSAAEAEREFRAAMQALDARRGQIAQARRALAELSSRRSRRDEARVLIETLRELKKEIERERKP